MSPHTFTMVCSVSTNGGTKNNKKVINNLWRRRQAVKSSALHAEVAGPNPAGVTNSLLTFYLSLHTAADLP